MEVKALKKRLSEILLKDALPLTKKRDVNWSAVKKLAGLGIGVAVLQVFGQVHVFLLGKGEETRSQVHVIRRPIDTVRPLPILHESINARLTDARNKL